MLVQTLLHCAEKRAQVCLSNHAKLKHTGWNGQVNDNPQRLPLCYTEPHPTALREGFATVPDVSLDDIGALDFLKAELDRYLLQPLKNPERFERLGLNRFSGIIMFLYRVKENAYLQGSQRQGRD